MPVHVPIHQKRCVTASSVGFHTITRTKTITSNRSSGTEEGASLTTPTVRWVG